jgi:chromosome segregation ATPase
LFFAAVIIFNFGLYMGCHSGPSFHDDTAYRAIEREADRNSVELAITGADIAAEVERIDRQADRITGELAGIGTAIGNSGLADTEKGDLLRRVSAAQNEAGILRGQVETLQGDVDRLNLQLVRQRDIEAALSEEHGRREVAGAEVKEDLAATKEKLAKVSGQRNLAVAIAAALALAIIGVVVIRVLRFFRIIPV